jgi:hypothetical protein
MTDMLAEPEFATYARLPSRETSIKKGARCTPMVKATLLVSASITLMLFDSVLAT